MTSFLSPFFVCQRFFSNATVFLRWPSVRFLTLDEQFFYLDITPRMYLIPPVTTYYHSTTQEKTRLFFITCFLHVLYSRQTPIAFLSYTMRAIPMNFSYV